MSDEQKDPKDPKDPKGDKKDERGPDGMTQEELTRAGGEQYAYLDQTRTAPRLMAGLGDGLPSSVLNSSVYPKDTKPEILHTEAEKAGADFPTGAPPDEVEDQSRTGEEIEEEYLKHRPYLRGEQDLPGQVMRVEPRRRDVPAAKH